MASLTSYGYGQHLLFVLFACLLLIAACVILFRETTHLGRRRMSRILPECAALLLILSVTLLFSGSWGLMLGGLMPGAWMEFERFLAGSFALIIGAYVTGKSPWSGLPLVAAGFLVLPLADAFLPQSALLAMLILSARLIYLVTVRRVLIAQEVTTASIRAGLDLLPDGILFAHTNGVAVLVNIQMLRFMERLLGQQFRSADAFWTALGDFDCPTLAEKRARADSFLFRFAAGDAWLVQRTRLTEGLSGWQMTASCVTELDTVTQELETKNALLSSVVSKQKDLLETLEKTERHRTLQEVTMRVHDILGQRISMLQQLLSSPAPKDALETIVRIDSLLETVPLSQEAHPWSLLADMVDTYRSLGVTVTLSGNLPSDLHRARAFTAIIREALSNAICHGRASAVTIRLSEQELHIRDNGLGCPHGFTPGGGMRGMMQRIQGIGGVLRITPSPHFELNAKVGENAA